MIKVNGEGLMRTGSTMTERRYCQACGKPIDPARRRDATRCEQGSTCARQLAVRLTKAWRAGPGNMEKHRALQRSKYANDPEFRARHLARSRARSAIQKGAHTS